MTRYVAIFDLPDFGGDVHDVAHALDYELGRVYGCHPDSTVWTEPNFALDLRDHDPTVWRVTRQDITDQAEGFRLPISDEEFDRIANAIDNSTVNECIEAAIGQVLTALPDDEED